MDFPLLRRCFLESSVKQIGEYHYFLNPISDGVPAVMPEVLEEAAAGLSELLDKDVELVLAPEAMGIPLAAALSLRTRVPFSVVRKKSYGLPGEIEISQKTGYSKSRMFVTASARA